jgi:hypothetical protein
MLDISSNHISGTLPEQWANFSAPHFSFLSLRNNGLKGTLPSSWSRLQDLNQVKNQSRDMSLSLCTAYVHHM